MLRDGCEIVASCRTENLNKKEYKEWLNYHAELLEFSSKNWEDKKTKGRDSKIAKLI